MLEAFLCCPMWTLSRDRLRPIQTGHDHPAEPQNPTLSHHDWKIKSLSIEDPRSFTPLSIKSHRHDDSRPGLFLSRVVGSAGSGACAAICNTSDSFELPGPAQQLTLRPDLK